MRPTMHTLAVLLALVGATACAPIGPGDELGDLSVSAAGGKADCEGEACSPESVLPPGASLSFADEGDPILRGSLYEGAEISVTTGARRFPRCGNAHVTGFVQTDGEEPVAFALEGGTAGGSRWGSFTAPEAEQIELFFSSDDGDCQEWDSNGGANFAFPVFRFRPAVLEFRSDWEETVHGSLESATTLVIDYDLDRLRDCEGSTNGYQVWGISAHALFNTGQLLSEPVTVPSEGGHSMAAVRAHFPIPAGASRVDLWFESSNRWGCHAYDSNASANYGFDLR